MSDQQRDGQTAGTPPSPKGPVRLRIIAVLIMLTTFLAFLLPVPVTIHLQIPLLIGVMAAATCFGVVVGLTTATVGLALVLWRDMAVTGSLTIGPIIDAILWFAVAKFAAALTAVLHKQYMTQRLARQEAEASARQQTLLLREMTHRTRNDMHRLIGMLNAQARGNPAAAAVLQQTAQRVLVQTRLNERLAMRGAETRIDSGAFLEELVSDIRNTIELGKSIGLTIAAESHLLAPAAAADIGLIVNELVTNALKHGFPGSASGIIRVMFRRVGAHDELYELLVTDNGVGPEPEQPSSGLGQSLLRALATQLGGRLTMSRGEVGGTQCRLLFPIDASRSTTETLATQPVEPEQAPSVPEIRRNGPTQ